MRTAVLLLLRTGVLLVTLSMPTSPARWAEAQSQRPDQPQDLQWAVLPGRALGPIRLGMSPGEVVQVVGPPTSRATDHIWTYDTLFQGRVEFHNGKVSRIETWDPRAVAADGLRIGVERAAVLKALGASPTAYQLPSGTWFHATALGLAVFVDEKAARSLAVMLPAGGIAARPSSRPASSQRRARSAPRKASILPGPEMQIVLEHLSVRVGSTVTINGVVRNAGKIPRAYVALVASVRNFRGESPGDKRVMAARSLDPGERQPFSVDLGKDLWESYAVRVDSYAPRQSGDRLDSASGFVSRRAYATWLDEDLTTSACVSTSVSGPRQAGPPGRVWTGRIRVNASITLPRYARAAGVVVRLRWALQTTAGASSGNLGEGVRQVVLRPARWDADIAVTRSVAFGITILEASVVRVDWRLNFQ